ncbi:hypothetical protein JCM10908_002605 [Rhodotorula pacifica]|uniref:anaphase promoting complex subunit CDC23 n=1 Tax=Rhodotorula pacifica TaxID=1495444 RepID=UPI0031788C1F
MAATAPPRPILDHLPDLETLRFELRSAVTNSLDRSMHTSAKFAAELLAALPAKQRTTTAAGAGSATGGKRRRSVPAPADFHAQRAAAAGSPHVQFRTSTPVKTPGAGGIATPAVATAAGNTSVAGAGPRLSGLGAATGGGGGGTSRTRPPRDSFGSVLSMGAGPSSPVVAIEEEDEEEAGFEADADADEHMHGNSATTAAADQPASAQAEWRARDEDEQDVHLLAQSYLRNHELLRAAHVLRECTGPRARWTRCYARFMAGEKRIQEEAGELLGVKDRPKPNPYTQELLDELASYEPGFIDSDGWLLYLKALLFLSVPPTTPQAFASRAYPDQVATSSPETADLRLAALETLVNSVQAEPYNWSAWLKIAECLDGPEELEATLPFLPSGYPLLFFYVHCSLEIHAANDVLLEIVDELEEVFGRECSTVTGMRALVHYHMRDFDDATAVFAKLHEADPYRLEDLDVLSNILYVSEKRADLATLAQEYTRVDRMRPETCCLVGNYFSLRRDHEKAITYFRRALKLDRSYLSAWTLMGHEYVEIKNTNAAIASYRRAVDVNRKDYRAWYGLGQTYELLGEPYYALNYYQRATALRPYDARMWSALATCNEKLKRVPDAIQCHQRALLATEAGEGSDIALRIGKLYASLGQGEHAAAYHRRALNEGLRAGAGTVELGRIYLWLAKWEMRRGNAPSAAATAAKDGTPAPPPPSQPQRGDLAKAEEYLRALEATQEHRDEAKTLLKELEVQMLSRA